MTKPSPPLLPLPQRTTAVRPVRPSKVRIRRAAALLAFGGCFSLVYRPERIAELFWHLQAASLAPKVVRTVQKDAASAPSLLLMTAKKGAAPGVLWRPPLILTDQKGGESAELGRIYGEEES